MLDFDFFDKALPFDDFMREFGTPAHAGRWQAVHDQVRLTAAQRELLGSFKRRMNVLVLAGAWCGDCVNQCPAFEHFAAACPALGVRYLDRDAHPEAQKELQVNGGNRVPVVVFYSEDGFEVARHGDRTLSAYRRMMAEQAAGDNCPTGLVRPGDSALGQTVQDWLDQFERAQWILRLSGRLRQKHGD